MTKLIFTGAITGLVLGLAGCVSPQQQAAQKEDLLAAAGFQVRVADTPQRLAAMKRLPPNKFVTRVVNGQPVYLMPIRWFAGASILAHNRTGPLIGRRSSQSNSPTRPK